MEIDGSFNRFLLSNGAKLSAHRYQVTCDEMTLERTPRGLMVDGAGIVAFCPCPNPPLTVGFSSAMVAPPTDLILRNARFRAYGVPVFWLPWFWVRSPNRAGMMSPRLSYRGDDGIFIGTGFHIPFSKKVEPSPEYLDISLGSYLTSGVDVGTQLVTANTVTNLRWDYRKRGLVEFDATGHRALNDTTSLAWHTETIRGERARTGYVSFEAASRAYDHGNVSVLHSNGEQLLSFGVQNVAMRGSALRDVGLWGPSVRMGIGSAIGEVGQVDTSTAVYGLTSNTSGEFDALAIQGASLRFDARPGPFAWKTVFHENGLIGTGGLSQMNEGSSGGESRLSLPLVRSFGVGPSRWAHWFEPEALSTVAWQRADNEAGRGRYESIRTAQIGVLNVFGRPRSSSATSLLLRGGWVVQGDEPSQALVARWLSSGQWLALGGSVGTVTPWERRDRAWMSTLRARFGRLDRVAVSANLEGRSVVEPTAVRWLMDDGFTPWLSRWYSRPGWTTGTQLDVGLLDQVAAVAGISVDLEKEKLLAHRMGVAYRHPCGCLAASTMTGWRVGRGGWDVTLLLDLMP
jgi:hypothetical protein